jgi:hypothetical protein
MQRGEGNHSLERHRKINGGKETSTFRESSYPPHLDVKRENKGGKRGIEKKRKKETPSSGESSHTPHLETCGFFL